ncbi:putative metal-dependent hydrolase family protein [Mycobacterium sp. MAC_080597_8934]|jgi:predicted metal-dependent hydrolase|nr:metal-dependent hydrolase [Mycobacterium avium]ETZ27091.1 putative metal-dependent hydrolase family protein [Mycobacterium intracellulare MIN_061107_1834]ETZ40418.1 putative metal-dependent hydrolase family protein [Mycobacterium intracellulare MIN_052511_1280]ETZ44625.1 putative metal-dependent hydrolase family protein [Mycobacterium avium MAV_120809_2495]ETZ54986.1 putative metal-dependent hydrolase family protein [Mycobacterium sp. MAC_011194_8550]ETZ59512.1 putative metal-dependent hydr
MPAGTSRQHFVDGDLVMSHFVSTLSATFPEGEDFFIRSVRQYRDQVSDPDLQEAVKGFIAQEATHRHQHRLLNERLQAMGYPTDGIDRHIKKLVDRLEKRFSPKMRLAVTAALEHYTATFAEIILTSDEAQELIGDTEVRPILLWHALEESEHKAVAFDVFETVGGTERTRVWGMRIATVILFTELVIQTTRSLAGDRAAYNPLRLLRSLRAFRRSPLFSPDAVQRFRSYTRAGFHPDDWDSTEVLERWAKELFDSDGAQRIGSRV